MLNGTVVTDASDSPTDPGSLRYILANVASGATITFNGNYTIDLTNGELPITKAVTISGTGQSVTINAQNLSRIFGVLPARLPESVWLIC